MRVIPTPDRVRVVRIDLDGADRGGRRDRALLAPDELERADRLARPLERRRHVAAHAALRTVLARVRSTDPGELRLCRDTDGRPRLDDGPEAPDFSLSHSEGTALVAVAPAGLRVGVDVEAVRDDLDVVAMARAFYQPEEQRAVAGPDGRAAFFRLWTAKEAYVKALGTGLAALREVVVGDGEAYLRPRTPSREGTSPGTASPGTSPGTTTWPVRHLDAGTGHAAALVTTAWPPAPRSG